MRKPKLSTIAVLGPIFFVVLALGVWLSPGRPWVFNFNTDIDINSGDFRDRVCVFCAPVKDRVYDSELSREVRRLGVGIPATRVWKRMGQKYIRVLISCEELLNTLNEVKAPDEERRVVLERLMTSLRTEDADRASWQGRLLRNEVAGKRGLHVFTPEFEEALRTGTQPRR